MLYPLSYEGLRFSVRGQRLFGRLIVGAVMTEFFAYAVDKRLAPFWLPFGFRPSKDGVAITDDGTFRATFGFVKSETPLSNIDEAHVTRTYRWWTAAGARGSMVDDEAAERVVRWTSEAVAAGASVTTGGDRVGATVTPTIVVGPPADASVVRHEVFGALVAVMAYDDFDAVIETCNESRYGLQAGLFTHDVRRIITAWRELEVGGVIVGGSSNFRLDHVPFGGVKDSGFGRESPKHMIEDYTVVKTLMLRDISLWGSMSTIENGPTIQKGQS